MSGFYNNDPDVPLIPSEYYDVYGPHNFSGDEDIQGDDPSEHDCVPEDE